jgi:hypothetical protein
MPRHWSRSIWVLGVIVFFGGEWLHVHALSFFAALGTVAGLFYGYWPRTRKRRAAAAPIPAASPAPPARL